MTKILYNQNEMDNSVMPNIKKAKNEIDDAISIKIYFDNDDCGYYNAMNSLKNNYYDLQNYYKWVDTLNYNLKNEINNFTNELSRQKNFEMKMLNEIIK